jgi:glyoxylase-like metal-dependent hydrolase (beta-lactamase superfamily II)
MKIGRFTIQEVIFGHFRLDGGCMFGSVPKNLWSKGIPADEENCIKLACRSLLIQDGDRSFLVDVGMGEKWSDKQRQIYGIKNNPPSAWGFDPNSISDIILTHLHFDHAGGITHLDATGVPHLSYPKARIHLQKANWEHAQNPTLKDRASYLPDTVLPLKNADLVLHDDSAEIAPGLILHRVDGHTRGQQWIEVTDGGTSLFFATDLIPTSHHIPLPYHMGYDVCAETLLQEKERFLKRAIDEDVIVCFQHDSIVPACRVMVSEKGHFTIKETVSLHDR